MTETIASLRARYRELATAKRVSPRDVDILLADVAIRVQLSPTNYSLAVSRANVLSEWIDRPESPLHGRVTLTYAQGSMAYNATIARCLRTDEFDIDIIAQIPTHPLIVVTGTYDPKGLNGSPYRQIDSSLLEVCTQRGVPFIEPSTGNVYDASGRLVTSAGPWITQDNNALYVGADGVHQSTDGQAYMASRMFDAVRSLSS